MGTEARVLVVEDEELIRRAFVRILRGAGLDVVAVEGAAPALERADLAEFAAILTDVSMPRGGGIDLLRQLSVQAPDVPVVLVSGVPDIPSALAAVELHAFRFLNKPVPSTVLVESVNAAIEHGIAARDRRAAADEVVSRRIAAGQRRASFESALDAMWIAYQPIVRACDGAVEAYEALLRTREPSLASPLAFLQLAEELGRTADVGRAVRSLAAAPLQGTPRGADLFVNLHPQDLRDEALYDPASPLAAIADRVVLEITERASLDDVGDVQACVQRLRAMGFRIAVDDLGAGYSGLTTFALLEPDIAKIDMSLVRDVDRSKTKQRLVRSVVTLARELGVTIVAEGVETVSERDTLVDLGCDLLQGYLFAKPGPAFPEVSWPASTHLPVAS
jgi:EAL domain-containing protein (putative c-di-GMP-specific phosphodiesterase class I)